MPAAWLAHDLHHEAWKRSTRTFLPMRERESKGSPPVMRGTCTAGAAGAAAPEEGAARRAARTTAGTKRLTAHSIGEASCSRVGGIMRGKARGSCARRITSSVLTPIRKQLRRLWQFWQRLTEVAGV